MRLEDAIQTRSFTSEYHRLRVNLLYTTHWLEGQLKGVLDPFGITRKQFNILRILRGHKGKLPLSILDIRERMIDATSDVSRMVDRMDRKGLVKRKPCTQDKRVTRVKITERGLSLLSQIDEHKAELDRVLGELGEKEASQLNQLLDKIRGV